MTRSHWVRAVCCWINTLSKDWILVEIELPFQSIHSRHRDQCIPRPWRTFLWQIWTLVCRISIYWLNQKVLSNAYKVMISTIRNWPMLACLFFVGILVFKHGRACKLVPVDCRCSRYREDPLRRWNRTEGTPVVSFRDIRSVPFRIRPVLFECAPIFHIAPGDW